MIATPARWSAVGEVFDIKDEASFSSDCSSASNRASWVVAKEVISTAPLGAMIWCKWNCGCGCDHVRVSSIWKEDIVLLMDGGGKVVGELTKFRSNNFKEKFRFTQYD